MNCCNFMGNSFEPKMNVYHGSNCNNYAHVECCCGTCCNNCDCCKCCCCCCCPYIPMPIEDNCSLCEQQMKNVLSQLITLYPTDNFVFSMEDGGTATGTPDLLYTDINKGLLCLDCESMEEPDGFKEYVSVCKIAKFQITSATYNPSITYLPAPVGPIICGCEESIRALLQVDDSVNINVGGTSTGVSTVKASEFGIVALATGANVQFVASCKIEKIRLMDEETVV